MDFNFDSRSRLDIYKDEFEKDENIGIVVYPTDYLGEEDAEIFPLTAKAKSRTIFCNENGYYAFFESDRYGFNNPDSEWDAEEIEYLLIGDSFTHGACVNRPHDMGSVLRNISNKNVLNLGYGGNGTLLELAVLREYFPRNKVKKLLWIHFEGKDIVDLEDELKNSFLKKYLDDPNFNQDLKSKVDEINQIAEKRVIEESSSGIINERKKNKLKNFIKLSKVRELLQPIGIDELKEPEFDQNFLNIIDMAYDYSTKNGAEFYFVYLPEPERYIRKNFENPNYLKLKKIITQKNIKFIDLHESFFDKYNDVPSLYPMSCLACGHFGIKGYQLTTENIFELTK